MIVFDNPLPSLTVRYIEVLRKTPNVNERNEALVFVTYGGTNMGSNLVRSQLKLSGISRGSKGRITNSSTI